MNKSIFIILICFLAACAAPISEDAIDFDSLSLDIGKLGEDDGFSGIYWVANEDSILFEAAYGYANLEEQTPITPDTRFNLASMNKLFTAAIVMRLRDAGKLELSDLVGAHLPDYPNATVKDSVTVQQLLSHTSGMGDMFTPAFEDSDPNTIRSLNDYLDKFVDEPLGFAPGESFGYSNAGYIVLGKVIEAVTGEDYYSYVQQDLFVPLGMNNTGWYTGDSLFTTVAKAYAQVDSTGQRETNPYLVMIGSSAGGGYSSANDLLLYARSFAAGKVVSASTLSEMREDRFGNEYGYGLTVKTLNETPVYGHNGGFPGVSGEVDIYPTLGLYAISLSNRGPRDGWATARSLVRTAIVGQTEDATGILNAERLLEIYRSSNLEVALAALDTMQGEITVNQLISASEGYDTAGEQAKAIDVLQLCITIDPENWFPISIMADLQFKSGDTPSAIENWKRSLVLNPDNQWAKDRLTELGQ